MSDEIDLEDYLDQPVCFHRCYVRICKSVTVGLFTSQAMFWSGLKMVKERGGWFYKSQEDWQEETGLTRHEQDTARKALREIGVLEERHDRAAHCIWFRINKANLKRELKRSTEEEKERKRLKELSTAGKRQCPPPLPENGNAHCREAAEPTAGIRHSSIETENTTENTTETPEAAPLRAASAAGATEERAEEGELFSPRTNTNRDTSEANAKGPGGAAPAELFEKPDGPSIDGMKFATWFSGTLPTQFQADGKKIKVWAKLYDDLMRLDKRTKREIIDVVTWARGHEEFWKSRFYTPMKLRQLQPITDVKYFDVFAVQMEHDKKNPKKKPASTGVPIREEDKPEIADTSEEAAAKWRANKDRLAAEAAA